MPFKDPEKRREYRRKWYEKNSISEKNHVSRRKKILRKWLDEYKNALSCSQCPENHPSTLDFHHTKGKDFPISYMISNGYALERVRTELKKCQVLCSNCHRKLHYSNKKL